MASSGFIIFSHIFPIFFGFIGILLLISGIMDDNKTFEYLGIGLFLLAAFVPFLILPLIV
ncbi:MAG: hypothetical protein MJ224_02920 [archaeon]|nr:hypothetical protein [archaeon]